MITVRPVLPLDTAPMARLLNEIIAEGSTTALTRPVTGADLAEWIESGGPGAIWHVAVDEAGEVVGFQWAEPEASLPDDALNIASFVKMGKTGLGIGSKLFDATHQAAKARGVAWINANIRADNVSGLTYYQSRGFRDYGRIEGYALADGRIVDKVLKRFDLD